MIVAGIFHPWKMNYPKDTLAVLESGDIIQARR